MSENSKIEWTDHTFNPWIGCTKVSPGCEHCYAETRDKRHLIEKVDHWGKGAPRLRTSAANWKKPITWNRTADSFRECTRCRHRAHMSESCTRCGCDTISTRQRVFCASQADWLDNEVPIEWLADLLALIDQTQDLDWLLLTKRPENFHRRVFNAGGLPGKRPKDQAPHNIWVGATVEDQPRLNDRIDNLRDIPARIRFLSVEPLLGRVDLICLPREPRIHWVICGGESGPGARPMHPQWARYLRDQCAVGEVPFFFKQWGEYLSEKVIQQLLEAGMTENPLALLRNPFVTIGTENFYRVGKHKAGRLLDGIEHNAFPA